jgi:hypothetical protein
LPLHGIAQLALYLAAMLFAAHFELSAQLEESLD